jgi:hypothetical protein
VRHVAQIHKGDDSRDIVGIVTFGIFVCNVSFSIVDRFMCKVCLSIFAKWSEYMEHVKVNHKGELALQENPNECDLCGSFGSNNDEFLDHRC